MAIIILKLNDNPQGEFELAKERMTIGRKSENDIPIDNLAISGIHAVILTTQNDSYIEDLGSTNGTYVNGKLIKKQLLKNGDTISIGKHDLTFIINQNIVNLPADKINYKETTFRPLEKAVNDKKEEPIANTNSSPALTMPKGKLHLLNGPKAGTELTLSKALITLGKPGVQIAVISRRPQGYFLSHIEGTKDGKPFYPEVNGESIGPKAYALNDNDMIDLAAIKMEFTLE